MPRGDRTGPMESGPHTGRGMGYCSGYPYPGFMNPGPGFGMGRRLRMGRGFGFGRGFGRGRGWRQGAFGPWGHPSHLGTAYGYPTPEE